MVNAAKRMRVLSEKIFHVRNHAGAVVLPSSSPIQLKSIYMRLPTGQYPNREYYWGAREFWRNELQRLKFWNPSIQSKVDTVRDADKEPIYLTVEYQSTSQKELQDIKVHPLPVPRLKIKPVTSGKAERAEKETSWSELKRNPLPTQIQQLSASLPSIVEQMNGQVFQHGQAIPENLTLKPVKVTSDILAHAPRDEIVVKAQPAANPSQPQSTSSPTTLYSRTITIPLAGLRHTEIWNWLRQHQDLPYARPTPASEMKQWQELCTFKKQAAKDRRFVKGGVDAYKKEKRELQKMKEATERMAQEG